MLNYIFSKPVFRGIAGMFGIVVLPISVTIRIKGSKFLSTLIASAFIMPVEMQTDFAPLHEIPPHTLTYANKKTAMVMDTS